MSHQAAKQPSYFCSVCHIVVHDRASIAAHKASKRHKERAGEAEVERQLYKADQEVTVADLVAVVERKRVERGVVPLSDLRVKERKRDRDDVDGGDDVALELALS